MRSIRPLSGRLFAAGSRGPYPGPDHHVVVGVVVMPAYAGVALVSVARAGWRRGVQPPSPSRSGLDPAAAVGPGECRGCSRRLERQRGPLRGHRRAGSRRRRVAGGSTAGQPPEPAGTPARNRGPVRPRAGGIALILLTGPVDSGASRGIASQLSASVTEVRSAGAVACLAGFITTIRPAGG